MERHFALGMAMGALALWTGLSSGVAQSAKSPPPVGASGSPGAVWYYCDNPRGYYPYVQSCHVAWRAVPVTPQGAPGAPAQ